MSNFNQRSLATLGELADEPVAQTGPMSDFVYIDISSIDRETKKITEPKPLTLMQAPSRAKQLLRTGDVLVSMTRPNLNAVTLVPKHLDGAIGSTGFHVLRSSWLRPEFLLRLVQSQRFVGEMSALVQGALYPAVRPKDIAAFTFVFETPAQQTRIVAKLEELLSDLDAGVAELKAAQQKLAQYRQSLLKAAVEGALTADWRVQHTVSENGQQLLTRILSERRARWEAKQLARFAAQGKAPPKNWQQKYPEPVAPDTTDLPKLPEGWVWASMGQLTEFITSGSRGWADYYADAGATFIRSQNINKDWLDLSDIAFVIPPAGSEGARTRVQQDDLLLTITGANVGKAAHVQIALDEAYVSQHVALIRVMAPFLAEFLHIFLTSDAGGRGQLNKQAYGAGKPGLNLQQIAAVEIPLPGPAEIQELLRAISVQVDAAISNETAIIRSLKQASAQRQNILRVAFAGELVPQDSNDEPASVLLERIRAERAAQAAVNKPRGRKLRASA
ncbi:restriction endonuclease [Rhodobacteraceae bacterium CH30]|nr:restriction endonuclease [Rhodobacteraceae bacterium CH30]